MMYDSDVQINHMVVQCNCYRVRPVESVVEHYGAMTISMDQLKGRGVVTPQERELQSLYFEVAGGSVAWW